MTDNGENWLSTAQAAQALRLSQRQVLRYVEGGQLRSRKAGRRVLISAADVARLADELAIEIPRGGPPARRSELPAEVVKYLAEQGRTAEEIAAAQRQALERLDRIERQIGRPAPLIVPQWLIIGGAAALVLLVLILGVLLLR